MLLPFPEPVIWLFVLFNIISWFLLEVWALGLDIGFFIQEAKIHTIPGFLLAILLSSLAIISQIANVFPAIQYNPKEYSPYIWICILLALSFFPLKSLILTVKWLYRYFYVSNENKEKEDNLNMRKKYLLSCTLIEKRSYLSNENFNINDIVIKNNSDSIIKFERIIGIIMGTFIVICYEWFNFEYSYSKSKEYIYDSEILAYILSCLIVITTFFLTGISVINMISNIFTLNYKYEYESFYYLFWTLQVIVFISSIFSIGVYYVVVPEFYKNSGDKKIIFTLTCCTTIFMILETGSFAMIEYFIRYLVSLHGTDNDKLLISFNEKINKITNKEEKVIELIATNREEV